ncbi:aromatic ring-hydroxylating dioxygenase subunit alpha [Ktedonobacter sp. SOSP1-52]|uniref:aromatic ring-hydroxylating oxygenase subunit alpha n=1 Tax=Ktedonobacter sp. SOSP1-52 TaxID=2778366 RepID=UPI001916A59A|nr:aromatic ring-hydroxylating dioxygenase subunit alpha [Ktedonobacter sp. SOSP1-52]
MSLNLEYRASNAEDEVVFPCQWYAVAWSKDLKNKPIRRRVIGREIVLFRDKQGNLGAVHAFCPHRGADLSLGTCESDGLRCAYHAWRFNRDGECTDVPAHPNRLIPSFANTTAYPVQERVGLVWVYPMPKQEIAALPELTIFPECEDPDIIMSPYEAVWEAHLTRVVESVLDVAHVPIVHNKTIGKNSRPEVDIDFDVKGDQITIINGGGRLDYIFPQHWILTPSRPGKSKLINYVTFTPIDKEVTAIFGLAGRNFAKIPGMNRIFSRYSSRVLKEDQRVVESQHPRPIPDALRMEAHVPADGPQVRFRHRWYKFLTNDEPRVFLNQAKA